MFKANNLNVLYPLEQEKLAIKHFKATFLLVSAYDFQSVSIYFLLEAYINLPSFHL